MDDLRVNSLVIMTVSVWVCVSPGIVARRSTTFIFVIGMNSLVVLGVINVWNYLHYLLLSRFYHLLLKVRIHLLIHLGCLWLHLLRVLSCLLLLLLRDSLIHWRSWLYLLLDLGLLLLHLVWLKAHLLQMRLSTCSVVIGMTYWHLQALIVFHIVLKVVRLVSTSSLAIKWFRSLLWLICWCSFLWYNLSSSVVLETLLLCRLLNRTQVHRMSNILF